MINYNGVISKNIVQDSDIKIEFDTLNYDGIEEKVIRVFAQHGSVARINIGVWETIRAKMEEHNNIVIDVDSPSDKLYVSQSLRDEYEPDTVGRRTYVSFRSNGFRTSNIFYHAGYETGLGYEIRRGIDGLYAIVGTVHEFNPLYSWTLPILQEDIDKYDLIHEV